MVIQFVRYTFAPQDAARAAEIFQELQACVRREPGAVRFDIARVIERPHAFLLWEEYRDEAALDAHRKTEHFERLVVNGIREIATERLAEVAILVE